MENKLKNELKYVLNLNAKNVVAETPKMILYKITDDLGIWLPIKNLWRKQVMIWELNMGVYENDTFKYRLVDLNDKNKYQLVTLESLTHNLLKKESEGFKINIKITEKNLTSW